MIEEYAREEADLLYHLNLGPSRRDVLQEEEREGSDPAAEQSMPKLSFEYIDQVIRNEVGGITANQAQSPPPHENELKVEVSNRQCDIKELLAKGLDKEWAHHRNLSARGNFRGKYSAKLGEEFWQPRDYDLSVDDLEEFKGYQQRADGCEAMDQNAILLNLDQRIREQEDSRVGRRKDHGQSGQRRAVPRTFDSPSLPLIRERQRRKVLMKEDKDHVLSESSDASCPGPHDEADLEEPSVAAREERRLSNSPTFVAWRARVRAKAINRDKLITKKKKTGGFQLKVKMLRQDSQSCIGQRATETSGKTSEGDSYLEFSNGKRKTLASGSKPRRSPFLQRSDDHEKALRPQGQKQTTTIVSMSNRPTIDARAASPTPAPTSTPTASNFLDMVADTTKVKAKDNRKRRIIRIEANYKHQVSPYHKH